MHVRVDFSNATILVWDAEAHPDRALVAHVARSASRPLRLYVARLAPDSVIPAIDEERNADVDDLRYECVPLLVRRVVLYLREDERVPALDDRLGQARHYGPPRSVDIPRRRTQSKSRTLTAEVQGQELLEANRDDVRCAPLACEEGRDLERWREPVYKVLGKAAFGLQVRVVRSDLDKRASGSHVARLLRALERRA